MPLLDVSDLTTELVLRGARLNAVDQVSFRLEAGATLALVGESGCGKSLTALALMQLLPTAARTVAGEVWLEGEDLLRLSARQMERVRGARMAMVFQEPMTSLNPLHRVGAQVAEPLRLHGKLTRHRAEARAVALLADMGIASPEMRARAYPHELSGGMRQRVMLAMALACDPAVLIADEPTTALDVTVQAQILERLRDAKAQRGLALLLITHDLGVVAETCERVLVMYAGRLVEDSTVEALFENPAHPYTRGLLDSMPARAAAAWAGVGSRPRLTSIPGSVPALGEWPSGCRFRTRCARATERCEREVPRLQALRSGQRVACHHPLDLP